MRQNETKLKPVQATVLEHLIAGRSVTDAAKSANVSRSTVHRWLKADFVFQAELNRSRRELLAHVESTLLSLSTRAAQTVAEAIEAGDVGASFRVLKGIGALTGTYTPIGSEDPDKLSEEDEIARQEDDNHRSLRRLMVSLQS